MNPAAESPYNVQVGGLVAVPFGILPPYMGINYSNNSFYYNHIFHKGVGNDHNNLILDLNLLMSNLKKNTRLRLGTDLEIINVGVKIGDRFLTVSLADKVRFGLSLPYDFMGLVINGNMDYMNRGMDHDLKKLDLNLTYYRELAIGSTIIATDKFRIGARVKFLFGLLNINTYVDDLKAYTNPENYVITFISDMKIKASSPIPIDYVANDSVTKFGLNEEIKNITNVGDFLLNFNNFGLGLDLGFTYKLNDDLEFFGSLNDIGFITWSTNPQEFKNNGNFEFSGIKFETDENGKILVDDFIGTLKDSLENTFRFQNNDIRKYTTGLTSTLYLGGKYNIHEKFNVGMVYRGEIYRKSYLQSLTLLGSSDLTNWFSAHVSYSISNNSFTNLGLGISIRAGFLNWFFVSDNIIGTIFPQKAKTLNLRMGCNMVFGYEKPQKVKKARY